MPNVLDRNFDFATNGTVTAAGLHNLIDETNIYAGLISTQEAKTTVGTGDLLLIADSSSIGSPQIAANRVTVQKLFSDTLTNGTFSGATITTGTIPTLTTGTTTSTNEVVTNGTITNLSATTSTFLGTITGSTNVINIGSGQIYKDASGNVGIGNTSPDGKLHIMAASAGSVTADADADDLTIEGSGNTGLSILASGDDACSIYFGNPGSSGQKDGGIRYYQESYGTVADRRSMAFITGITERMRIDSSGNVGIGTSSPTTKLDVNGKIRIGSGNDYQFDSTLLINGESTGSSGYIRLYTNSQERLRIDSDGNVLVGTSDSSLSTGVGFKFQASSTIPRMGIVVNSTTDSNYHLYNTNATFNGYRFYVATNGGIANFSANNSNLSDARLKTDIQNAGNYLEKICSIPVKTFLYKDQGDDTERTIGVIAQEVEAHIPELINNDGFGETPEDGIPLKTIYQTDLQYVLMRCIQEQQVIINELKTKVSALEAA